MIVITGASEGLGYELAKQYKERGDVVVNVSRRSCDVADHNICHDLSTEDGVTKAVVGIFALNMSLDILVHNAGVYSDLPIDQITEDEFEKLFHVNVNIAALLNARLMQKIQADSTDIVFIISTAGTKGNPDHAAYAASKWALRGYAEAVRNQLKKTKSRVINVYPGGMKTKFFAHDGGEDPTANGEYWLEPTEVAKVIVNATSAPKNMEVSEITINRKVS